MSTDLTSISSADGATLDQLVRRASDFQREGRLAEAEAACKRALALRPGDARAFHVLGIVYHQTGRACEGLALLRRAVAADPSDVTAQANLAAALGGIGRMEESLQVLRRAIDLRPGLAAAHNNLGVTLERMDRPAEAAEAYAVAIDLDRRNPAFCANRGNALRRTGDLDAAEAAYRRALAVHEGHAPAWKGLGLTLQDQGRLDDAMQALREVVRLDPADASIHSTLLICGHYHAGSTQASLFADARAWARRHAGDDIPRVSPRDYRNVRSPDRRLRIGYLSPDLRDHVVGRLLEPVLAAHDRAAVEVFVYNDLRKPDGATSRMKPLADRWREVADLSDQQLAERVASDGIDILVETAGHFVGHRLSLMARRPAPVQVSAFGYCGTSGVAAVDYRVSDVHSDPPGNEAFHAERLLRLPECANCYRPQDGYPDVGPLPALKNAFVTFCCFNNPVKITDVAVALWSRILDAVDRSQLLVLMDGDGRRLKARFAALGLDPDRVCPVGKRPRFDYMALYNRCDVSLDTLPFNGDNTTFDALWMGVPTVTLAGDRFATRRGLSHMTVLGYAEWIAHTGDAYVEKAVALASDLPRLAEVRAGLRARFAASPLGDVERWTRNLEAAYRRIWVEWCEGRRGGAAAAGVDGELATNGVVPG